MDETRNIDQAVRRSAPAALTGLFVLGLFYTAYFARAILIPIALALLLALVLAPLVRGLNKRLRIPQPVAAVLLVLTLVAGIIAAFYVLATPAAQWMTQLPSEMAEIERKLRPLGGQVQDMQDAAKHVEQLAQGGEAAADRPLAVVVRGPSLTQLFLGHTMAVSLTIIITLILLLFLLASGDSLLRQAVTIPDALSSKKQMVEIIRETEEDISHYLLSISVINTILGVTVGFALWALGMPNPLLWGAMAALFNFVPLIGPLVGVSVMTLVAITAFDTVFDILLPPIVYLALHNLEAQCITPLLLSRRLVLNPVAILLSLILWSWLWGIPGALLAVPLLSALKIVCDHVESLHPIGVMLGRGVPAENNPPAG